MVANRLQQRKYAVLSPYGDHVGFVTVSRMHERIRYFRTANLMGKTNKVAPPLNLESGLQFIKDIRRSWFILRRIEK